MAPPFLKVLAVYMADLCLSLSYALKIYLQLFYALP